MSHYQVRQAASERILLSCTGVLTREVCNRSGGRSRTGASTFARCRLPQVPRVRVMTRLQLLPARVARSAKQGNAYAGFLRLGRLLFEGSEGLQTQSEELALRLTGQTRW